MVQKDTWYKNALGMVFDVRLREHPTFKYLEYILENTKENQFFFKCTNESESALLFLRDGFTGVHYKDAEIVEN